MEDRLKGIIIRIENSTLSDASKAQLYTAISEGLQASIWPALLKFVSESELDSLLAEIDEKKKVERYSDLIVTAVNEGNALAEVEDMMNKLLDEVDSALTEEKI